jgi:tellurite resistance protein TehA-like permease
MSDALHMAKKLTNIAMLLALWFILIGIAIFSTPVRLVGELSEKLIGAMSDKMYDLENQIDGIQTQE